MRRVTAILALTAFALVLAPTAAAGGGCHWESSEWTSQTESADEVTAHIAGCRFEPTTLHIEPGTTVTWLNKDPVPHSVTGPFLSLGGDELLNQGQSTSVTFDEVGVFPYYCVLHPGMAAAVVVGDSGESATGAGSAAAPGGKYDASGPIEGDSTAETAAIDDSSSTPVVTAVAATGVLVVLGTTLIVRRRRRTALPVPGALP